MIARFALAVILATTLAVRAHASCPLDTLESVGTPLVSTPNSTDAITDTRTCTSEGHVRHAGAYAQYNLTKGLFHCDAYGQNGFCGDFAQLITHDDFTLLGPAGSSPITFTAQLNVAGSGSVAASIQEGSSAPVSFSGSGQAALPVTIVRAPGEHFALCITSGANGLFDAPYINSSLTFPDLPSGYAVTSCQGYATDLSVATRASTWGRLKLSYH